MKKDTRSIAQRIDELFATLRAQGWKTGKATGGSVWYKEWVEITVDGTRLRVTADSEDEGDLTFSVWTESCAHQDPHDDWDRDMEFHIFTTDSVILAACAEHVKASRTITLMSHAELLALESWLHDGASWYATGKVGTDAATNQMSREFAIEQGARRLWVRQDGTVTVD